MFFQSIIYAPKTQDYPETNRSKKIDYRPKTTAVQTAIHYHYHYHQHQRANVNDPCRMSKINNNHERRSTLESY